MTGQAGVFASVEVPVRTTSKTNDRHHWRVRAKHARSERAKTATALHATGHAVFGRVLQQGGRSHIVETLRAPPLPCTVTLTRCSVSELDDDNVRGALKSVRDAIAAWLGVDDRDPQVAWNYEQARAPRGDHTVRIVVERWS